MPAHDASGAAALGATAKPRWQDTLHEVLRVCEVDAVTASTVDAVLFADDGDPPTITPDEAAVLVEALKDLFYQSYVRTAKLRAALRMRRFFAGENTEQGHADRAATAGASSRRPLRPQCSQFGASRAPSSTRPCPSRRR